VKVEKEAIRAATIEEKVMILLFFDVARDNP
jgi:hypothetical protein